MFVEKLESYYDHGRVDVGVLQQSLVQLEVIVSRSSANAGAQPVNSIHLAVLASCYKLLQIPRAPHQIELNLTNQIETRHIFKGLYYPMEIDLLKKKWSLKLLVINMPLKFFYQNLYSAWPNKRVGIGYFNPGTIFTTAAILSG